MDVKDVDPQRLIKMLRSTDEELSNLAREIIEYNFGEFTNPDEMISYL